MTTTSLLGRSLLVAVGAFTLTSLLDTGTAEAGRFRFSGHAGVHFGGGVHVNYARPAPQFRPHRWSVSGHIYIGPQYTYRPYYYYTPEYVPSYYPAQSYYPIAPAPSATAQTVVVAANPELPRFGLGLFAGGASVEDRGSSTSQSSDLGVVGRFRLSGGLLVEGELGKTSYAQDVRVDRRLGASLVYEIGAYNRFAPYVLAGLGVQNAETNGAYSADQSYGEIGAGLRYAVTPSLHLSADLRLGSRATMSNDADMSTLGTGNSTARTIAPPPTSSSDTSENYSRGRIAAILYF
ncbi:MAG: outer membrane beta-barrel protein [Proteobacteria bacterium]|nr:outer membrane beta-barrel protein [Pseudomonadota bacterium]